MVHLHRYDVLMLEITKLHPKQSLEETFKRLSIK